MFWKSLDHFRREMASADDERLVVMRDWAAGREQSADASGMGRNPKARRSFRLMREAAEEALDARGLLNR